MYWLREETLHVCHPPTCSNSWLWNSGFPPVSWLLTFRRKGSAIQLVCSSFHRCLFTFGQAAIRSCSFLFLTVVFWVFLWKAPFHGWVTDSVMGKSVVFLSLLIFFAAHSCFIEFYVWRWCVLHDQGFTFQASRLLCVVTCVLFPCKPLQGKILQKSVNNLRILRKSAFATSIPPDKHNVLSQPLVKDILSSSSIQHRSNVVWWIHSTDTNTCIHGAASCLKVMSSSRYAPTFLLCHHTTSTTLN